MRTGALILTGEVAPVDPIAAIERELGEKFETLRARYVAGELPARDYSKAVLELSWKMDALIDYVNNVPRQMH